MDRNDVVLPLTTRDLRRDDLAGCEWSGGSLHLAAVAGELERAAAGEVDYLAVCTPAGSPVAIGEVDFLLFPDAGYLGQLAVHPLLQRCGIGTLLVGALENRVRRRGRPRAELRCEEREAGNRAFYERLGYTAYGTVADGWDQRLPNGEIGRYETVCVQMRRDLRPPALPSRLRTAGGRSGRGRFMPNGRDPSVHRGSSAWARADGVRRQEGLADEFGQ